MTATNEAVQPFHDRMPAILRPEDYSVWLGGDTELKATRDLVKPLPAELMTVSKANTLVNDVKDERPRQGGVED